MDINSHVIVFEIDLLFAKFRHIYSPPLSFYFRYLITRSFLCVYNFSLCLDIFHVYLNPGFSKIVLLYLFTNLLNKPDFARQFFSVKIRLVLKLFKKKFTTFVQL